MSYIIYLPFFILQLYSFLMENRTINIATFGKKNILFLLFFSCELIILLFVNKLSYFIILIFLFSFFYCLIQVYRDKKILYYSNIFLLIMSIIIFLLVINNVADYNEKYFKFLKITMFLIIYLLISFFYFVKICINLIKRFKIN